MISRNYKPWWKRRRFWWPLAALAVLGAVASLAILRLNCSRIVVCNDTGETIDELTVAACGQSRTFHGVEDGSSVRFKLSQQGAESEISVSVAGVERWKGDYIEPRGGYFAIVRMRRGGEIDCRDSVGR